MICLFPRTELIFSHPTAINEYVGQLTDTPSYTSVAVFWLMKKFPAVMELKGSSPSSQKRAFCPYSEPSQFSTDLHNLFPLAAAQSVSVILYHNLKTKILLVTSY
jgi:hypothetical protein